MMPFGFNGASKSIVCQEDVYLRELVGISVPGVGYSVERGEIIARYNDYQLIE